ncbi:MAG TPA: peptidoglycan-binding domain-containing protein [Leptospiraceae bacterium]|nr:peptidoglycan-binding domain-containing protein [Leptospiraceae bacterium]
MLRNFSFKVILVSIVLAVFATCSSAPKKDAKDAASTKDAKDSKDVKDSKDAAVSKDAKTAPASTRSGSGDASADKEKVGMRSADESATNKLGSLPENPPLAKAGQCWIPVYSPATYREVNENVVKRAATEKIEIIPARYESTFEQVLVKPASTTTETIPATYEMVEETVVVRAAGKKIEQIPAVYETVEEKVVDKEGYTEWKKDSTTGIKCLVEVPPTYKMVTKEVIKTPASTKEVDVPEEKSVIQKQVLKTPETTRTIEIPAEYRTVQIQKLVEPEKEFKAAVPAEYQTVSKKVIDQPEKSEWREILCENNTTKEKLSEVQKALKAAGFDPGSTEGNADAGTFKALNEFQKSKNLPVDEGKHINMTTVRALGVSK